MRRGLGFTFLISLLAFSITLSPAAKAEEYKLNSSPAGDVLLVTNIKNEVVELFFVPTKGVNAGKRQSLLAPDKKFSKLYVPPDMVAQLMGKVIPAQLGASSAQKVEYIVGDTTRGLAAINVRSGEITEYGFDALTEKKAPGVMGKFKSSSYEFPATLSVGQLKEAKAKAPAAGPVEKEAKNHKADAAAGPMKESLRPTNGRSPGQENVDRFPLWEGDEKSAHDLNRDMAGIDPDSLSDFQLKAKSKSNKRNIILLSDPGVGRTTTQETFLELIRAGKVEGFDPDIQIIKVKRGQLAAKTEHVGQADERFDDLIRKANASGKPALIVIDNLNTLSGTGSSSSDSVDFLERLNEALGDPANKNIRLFATATNEGLDRIAQSSPELLNKMQTVKITEPSGKRLTEIGKLFVEVNYPESDFLKNPELAKQIELAAQLSQEIEPTNSQPSKLIDFLDSYLQQNSKEPLDQFAIRKYKIHPVYLTGEKAQEHFNEFEKHLDHELMGMEEAKAAVKAKVKASFSGLNDPNKPRLLIGFAGDSSTGKTEINKVTAEALGTPLNKRTRIQFSGLTSTGQERVQEVLRKIASAVQKEPYGYILLDEVEKGGMDVQNALLEMFERGEFTFTDKRNAADTIGTIKTISIRNAHFGLTSNAATKYLAAVNRGEMEFDPKVYEAQLEAGGLARPLITRVKFIPTYYPTKAQMKQIVLNNMEKIIADYKTRRKPVEVDFKNRDEYAQHITDLYYGEKEQLTPRQMIEKITTQIQDAVSDIVLPVAHLPQKKVEIEFDPKKFVLGGACGLFGRLK